MFLFIEHNHEMILENFKLMKNIVLAGIPIIISFVLNFLDG